MVTPTNYSINVNSGVKNIYGGRSAPIDPEKGLQFKENGVTGSDIRIVWDGANLLDRDDHTAIWLAKYDDQLGYYATAWHAANTGTWAGSGNSSNYGFGTHPYPCDGTYDANGQALVGTSSTGTVHYQEIAGLTAKDHIQKPDGPFILVDDGRWLAQARTCHTDGTNLVHRFYPDVLNATDEYIEITQTISSVYSDNPTDPAFYFGASDWTVSGSTNDECPFGVLRGFRLFDAALSWAEVLQEVNAIGNGNNAVSTTGLANTWYINDNPTVADITDKSGANHSPSWANTNRPTDVSL